MAAKDIIHEPVRKALENDGWTITDDPLTLKYEDKYVLTDLGTKLATYRQLIKRILQEYVGLLQRANEPGVETATVFDEERDHYLLHTIGWADRKHVWNTTVYVRLRDGKFYIEIDWTEQSIATDLLEAGVPKEDIVLAFHHPSMRPYTEFAVA